MGDDTNDDLERNLDALAIGDPYKVLGDLDDRNDGIGVLGRNTATTGKTKGVEGRVDSPYGYGLATPDDALVKGALDAGETDFVVEAGTTATTDATNVILGHASNRTASGVVGATISGGGYDGGLGGVENVVYDDYGTIGGGLGNRAGQSGSDTAELATVGGGKRNYATGQNATVAGGLRNRATDRQATLGGGAYNRARGANSTVAGGSSNNARADQSTIGGGGSNDTSGESATIAGGFLNTISDDYGAIGGGQSNQAGDAQSGSTTARYATVGGGQSNAAKGAHATVGGGDENVVDGPSGAIAGGKLNAVGGSFHPFVGGGFNNSAGGTSATIGGGSGNATSGNYSTIAGGVNNHAYANADAIGGGEDNQAGTVSGNGPYATVGGGKKNEAKQEGSTVGGGKRNTARRKASTVGGGRSNEVNAKDSTIAGGKGNFIDEPGATVSGGSNNTASGSGATLGGGTSNYMLGTNATIPGGERNVADGNYSFAAGRRAEATEEGTFVWSDSTASSFTSATSGAVLFDATNGVGVDTPSPDAPLDVKGGGLLSQEGTVKIGTDDVRLNLGVDAGGDLFSYGTIRARSGDSPVLHLGVGTTDVVAVDSSAVYPTSNDTYDLGTSNFEWSAVYAANGTIQSSDARLKQNVTDVEDGPDLIQQLRPVRYEWADEDGSESDRAESSDAADVAVENGNETGERDESDDAPDEDRRLGLIAQEVADVVPEAVVEPDDEDGYFGMNYESLVPLLVDAVQQQQDRIDDLEAELRDLRVRVGGTRDPGSGERGPADD